MLHRLRRPAALLLLALALPAAAATPPADWRVQIERAQRRAAGQGAVILSAATGEGVDLLEAELARMLTGGAREVSFLLPVSDGRRLAWLHAHGDVLADDEAGEGDEGPMRRVTVRLNPKELGQFASLS